MSENLILRNGQIHTIDSDNTVVDCAVIKNGKFVYVGDYDENVMKQYDLFPVLDLGGRTVLPAFLDAHMHMTMLAQTYYGVNLQGYNDVEKYKDVIRTFLEEHPDAPFLTGSGWFEGLIPVTGPLKEDLDEISTEIPIVLTGDSGHSAWVNSKALELAGINKDTPDVETGVIQRYPDGTPSGTLRESWFDYIKTQIPDFTIEQYKDVIRHYAKKYYELGVIGSLDAWMERGGNSVEAFKELAEDDSFNFYGRGTYMLNPDPTLEDLSKNVKARAGDNKGEKFAIDTVKIFEDGVLEGRTGYLLEPYSDCTPEEGDFCSIPVWPQDVLNVTVERALKAGFQVHVHAIGDAAVKETINAFWYAIKERGCEPNRSIITHIELIEPEDIDRMEELGLVAVLNPYWANVDDLYFANLERIGKERTERTWPMKSIADRNIICGIGSDYPVTDIPSPLNAIEMGMTRQLSKYFHPWTTDFESGKYDRCLGDGSEKVSLDEMVRMTTFGSAYSMGLDDITGTIEVGKNGDFIVLDQDIYSIPADEITGTKVLATYMKGKEVYYRE